MWGIQAHGHSHATLRMIVFSVRNGVPVADHTGDLRAVVSGNRGFERQRRAVSLRDGSQRRRLIKDYVSADVRVVLFPSTGF